MRGRWVRSKGPIEVGGEVGAVERWVVGAGVVIALGRSWSR
jgi:hypothetical protein